MPSRDGDLLELLRARTIPHAQHPVRVNERRNGPGVSCGCGGLATEDRRWQGLLRVIRADSPAGIVAGRLQAVLAGFVRFRVTITGCVQDRNGHAGQSRRIVTQDSSRRLQDLQRSLTLGASASATRQPAAAAALRSPRAAKNASTWARIVRNACVNVCNVRKRA
jgi:hypothetical protein